MHESQHKTTLGFSGLEKVVLIGQPNVGKSVIFGQLTGQYVTVSNYPGTTVEISRGVGQLAGQKIGFIDVPGLNSLVPASEDEKVARDILFNEDPRAIVQVADAKNLRRSLLLTLQLIELELPLTLDLNMIDELNQRRISLDKEKLAELLDLPVLGTVAVEGVGIGELKKTVLEGRKSSFKVNYGEKLEEALLKMAQILPKELKGKRALSLMILAGDKGILNLLERTCSHQVIVQLEQIRAVTQAQFAKSLGQLISEIRHREATRLADLVTRQSLVQTAWLQKLGNLTMQPLFGWPILILVLYIMYKLVGDFAAQTGVGYLEEVIFGHYFNPWATDLVSWLIPFKLVQDFFVGEYGVITMALTYALAIVLPIITMFFLFFSVLEDSGYLPRLAILLNKSFRLIGLSGKAIIPMVLGLGCDTMATMTARTLETKRERIIAILLLALAVPCSAQLGVILGMIAGVSATATLLWAGTIIFVLLLVGFLAGKFLPGKSTDFILEIPPLRIPKFSNILVKTLARLEWYLREAVPLFILGTAILFVLDKLAILQLIEQLASPVVVNFLGLPAKATQAFLIGFLRRDYGAAGLFALARAGQLNPNQIVVSLITITLFVPCIAQFLVMIKEQGLKIALWITALVFFLAFFVGGVVNIMLNYLGIVL